MHSSAEWGVSSAELVYAENVIGLLVTDPPGDCAARVTAPRVSRWLGRIVSAPLRSDAWSGRDGLIFQSHLPAGVALTNHAFCWQGALMLVHCLNCDSRKSDIPVLAVLGASFWNFGIWTRDRPALLTVRALQRDDDRSGTTLHIDRLTDTRAFRAHVDRWFGHWGMPQFAEFVIWSLT
jgi:hypothetical protein